MATAKRPTPRERARAEMTEQIKAIARDHLAVDGPNLSLRAVARDLGVVSSAVYRYVRNRDELLTLLVVEAYDELGEEVEAAVTGVPESDPAGQLRALGRAVRSWGLREPARYALLFGSPVPGYAAPAEQTTEPGTRVVRSLVQVVQRAHGAGLLAPREGPRVSPALGRSFTAVRDDLGLSLPDEVLVRGVQVWSALFGAVGFEVFDQYGADTFADQDSLFEACLTLMLQTLGLDETDGAGGTDGTGRS